MFASCLRTCLHAWSVPELFGCLVCCLAGRLRGLLAQLVALCLAGCAGCWAGWVNCVGGGCGGGWRISTRARTMPAPMLRVVRGRLLLPVGVLVLVQKPMPARTSADTCTGARTTICTSTRAGPNALSWCRSDARSGRLDGRLVLWLLECPPARPLGSTWSVGFLSLAGQLASQ